MDPLTIGLITAGIGAAGSIGGGLLSRGGNQETKTQKTQRHLIDDLLSSLSGDGKYKDLFATDEAAFQKSYVEPSKQRFNSQIAPQIQQQYIANGQQRGTGLDDQLLRAGVDLDQMLNQSYLEFQNQGKDRMQSTINAALGSGQGAPRQMSTGDAAQQATGGYLSSEAFSDSISNIIKSSQGNQTAQAPNPFAPPPRKGFEPDNKYNLPNFSPYAGR